MIAAAMFRETVDGSGNAATEEREVGAVTEVSLSGIGNLTVREGDVPEPERDGRRQHPALLETETDGRSSRSAPSPASPSGRRPDHFHPDHSQAREAQRLRSGKRDDRELTGENLSVKLSGAGTPRFAS